MNGLMLCKVCNGRKTVSMLGGIEKECTACKGKAYITQVGNDNVEIKENEVKPLVTLVNDNNGITTIGEGRTNKIDKRSKDWRNKIMRDIANRGMKK